MIVVRAMFDTIAPRYDLLDRIIAFGLDQVVATAHDSFLGPRTLVVRRRSRLRDGRPDRLRSTSGSAPSGSTSR